MTCHSRWFRGGILAIGIAAVAIPACGDRDEPVEASAPALQPLKPVPVHGGLVIHDGQDHLEVVADASGRLEVWIVGPRGEPKPATTATAATASVRPPSGQVHKITLARDAANTHWVGNAGSIGDMRTRITFTLSMAGRDRPVEVDSTAAQLLAASRPGHDSPIFHHADDAEGSQVNTD